jgi:integrase
MAFMENRNGKFRIKFRFEGRQYSRSLNTSNEQKAGLAKGQIERNLELVSLGLLEVPDACDVFDFFLTGKVQEKPTADARAKESKKQSAGTLSIERLFNMYFDAFLKESIEENSFGMLETHRNNLERLIGKRTKAAAFGTGDIQKYVDKRAKEPGRRGKIQATTIRKEITTLSTIFKWAVSNGHLNAAPEKKGIRYPKGKEKPPFQTWEEIERKIKRGGLSDDEVADLLSHVKLNARHAIIYPAFAFAAHTGARRSEIARSQLADIDFESDMITIRELKRVRGMQSTRRVPMSPFLKTVLASWIADHPGGQMTFSMPERLERSRKEREIGTPVTASELHKHFKQPLKGTKWEVLHGWHALRHSFCSNCAAVGVEQRLINDWVGHQTAAMVRRYRHLFPNKQQQAIQNVFGNWPN